MSGSGNAGGGMNANQTTARALLGLFSETTYNTIGDQYGKKPKPDPRHMGKQLVMERPHRGLAGATPSNALFDKEFRSLHKGDKYEDRTMYYKTQPRDTRKTGFMSSDAFKSDEFTMHFPTEQWRERIRAELEHVNRTRATLEQKMAEMSEEEKAEELRLLKSLDGPKPWSHGPAFLFDIGKPSLGGETAYCIHDARDTWYSKTRQTLLSRNVDAQKRMGPYRTFNQVYGQGSENVTLTKPAFARTPFIKENFYRSSGIPFSSSARAPTV